MSEFSRGINKKMKKFLKFALIAAVILELLRVEPSEAAKTMKRRRKRRKISSAEDHLGRVNNNFSVSNQTLLDLSKLAGEIRKK